MIREVTNHVWQSTLFALAAGLLTIAFRRNRAHVRYWLWFTASVKFLIPFSLLIGLGSQVHWAPETKPIVPAIALTMVEISQPFTGRLPLSPGGTRGWVPSVALVVWLCGFVAIALWRSRNWLRIRAAIRAGIPLKVASAVEVRSSPGLLEPGVAGVFGPILLLPAGIEERLTQSQLAAVLAHELCHVRRRDNLFAAIHMVVEAAFWFHPLVWWIGSKLIQERERACDEEVLRLGSAPQDYAEGILNVCKIYVESPLACVSGVTGSDLRKRIEAIMTNRAGQTLSRARKFVLAGIGIASLAWPIVIGIGRTPAVRAQSPMERPLVFDAASIKPIDEPSGGRKGPGGGNMQITPERGRVYSRAVTTRGIIREAYHLVDQQISGGPGWLDSGWYTVEAKAAGPASGPDLRRMLQTLLAERFRLAAHRDSKPTSVYLLTVGKSGLKVPELKDGDPTPDRIPKRTTGPGPAMIVRGTMEDFAYMLSRGPSMDRLVLDKTGLQGVYFFGMQWSEDEEFLTVMQEQFGLKLESQRAPVDILVIDHIEKPEAN